MRNILIILLCSFLLAACGNSINTTAVRSTPSPGPVSPVPTRFSLGKCTDARQPTPNSSEASLFAPVDKKEHILGKENAYVTILVYSDFQCASCAKLASLLKSFVEKYPQDVRVVFRHFPLESLHDKAALSAQAAEAAALQGKFWEMHDFLFSKQSEWLEQKPEKFKTWILEQATELGLDQARLQSDMNSPAVVSMVQNTWDEGQKIKLPGVPVILINNEIMKWQINLLDQLESLVLLARLTQRQFGTCPPLVIDPSRQYTARLNTSKGEVLLRLFVDKAPNTVNNFVFLAQQGWYDNVPFHLVVSGFLAQTGDPTGTGLGGPGYYIPSEENTTLLYDRAGMLGMANSGLDTNGSQFFITLSAAPGLNKDYPIFGEVISGMDVLARLTPRNPYAGGVLPPADTLINVKIEVK